MTHPQDGHALETHGRMIGTLYNVSPQLAAMLAGVAIMGAALFKPAEIPPPSLPTVQAGAPASSGLSLDARMMALEADVAQLRRHAMDDWQRYGTFIGASLAGLSGLIAPRRQQTPAPAPNTQRSHARRNRR